MRKITVATLAGLTLAAAGLAQAEPATYGIDPTHTFVTFEIDHMGASTNRGRFDKKDGSVKLDKAAKKGSVEITIDMASINTGTAAFDKHLQSADFFNVEKFPAAKFTADKFSFNGDKVSQVAGSLTLMGKTQPVTLKASKFACYENPMLKREVCGGDFETTIDRSAYGIDFGLNWGFPKDVKLVIQVEAVKQ
jgi:polyisoprenoid-binding protein YceI